MNTNQDNLTPVYRLPSTVYHLHGWHAALAPFPALPLAPAGDCTVEWPHCTLHLALREEDGALWLTGALENTGEQPLPLEQLTLTIDEVDLGQPAGELALFKNGYQSWSETRMFTAGEREQQPLIPIMGVMQANPRNAASGQPGKFVSEMFAVLGRPPGGPFLLLGQAGDGRQFVYVRADLGAAASPPRLELVHDFGGQLLPSGERVELDPLVLLVDDHANRVQERYFDLVQVDAARTRPLPTGWCSWYYYFTRVSAGDLDENLAAAQAHDADWQIMLLDDGYQTAVGDWLSINDKFPHGLRAFADNCRAVGMIPGLWLAPFIARRNSRLYHQHPEWTLKGKSDRPLVAGWNPNWGRDGVFYGLDVTHPDFQDYIRRVIATVVHEWSFGFLKLDFTYGAALPGRACDRSLSAAERLQLGYRLVRETAGDDVLILGCGSPLSPARGLVDTMRIGPDVAPYWVDTLRTGLTRDPHALCTKFAIRSILNRCQLHRRLWINDPDCLLLRDTDTRLTADERFSLVNAAVVTGGMVVVSDNLARLAPATWQQIERITALARQCDQGTAWALDYMERDMPELVYNSQGYLAVFNFADRPVHKRVVWQPYLEGLVDPAAHFVDVWSDERLQATRGILDLGPMPAHSSRLLHISNLESRMQVTLPA